MRGRLALSVTVVVLSSVLGGSPAALGADGKSPAVLAKSVPADARLYLEFRGSEAFAGTPLGPMMTRMISGLLASSRPAGEGQPADGLPAGWRIWFAETVGLPGPRAADLLFTGPVALAAEGWSGLGDAVLLAEPKEPALLEEMLAAQKFATSAKVRRYRLIQDHELACDGRNVVVGRAGNSVNLYYRTVAMWESEGGATLGEIADFRERMAGLPSDLQVVFYAGASSRAADSQLIFGQWWPASWGGMRSLALGARIDLAGLAIDMNGRGEPDRRPSSPPLALDALSKLPASTVVAWTQPVQFVDSMRRLLAQDEEGILHGLLADMPGRSFEVQLLQHLVGSAVFVIAEAPLPATNPADGAISVPATSSSPATFSAPATEPPNPPPVSRPASVPATASASAAAGVTGSALATSSSPATVAAMPPLRPASQPVRVRPPTAEAGLVLPSLAMLVETDDPHAVEASLERLTVSLQYLVATRSAGDPSTIVRRVPDSGGGRIVSISLGRLFESQTECPFLVTLELSWMVWDRWLFIGSNTEVVRQIVAARRGEGNLLGPAVMPQLTAEVAQAGAVGQMFLVAQPRVLASMLDSWVTFITARYPQMLQPEWWRRLERRQRSTRVQLGVVPTARELQGAVEVGQTLPEYPAFGLLQPGDLIVGVDGQSLAMADPSATLRQMLAVAGEAGQVTLRIERGGRQQDVVIPMPRPEETHDPVQPIVLIRQVARFLRPFPIAGYAVWRPSPELLRAHLELRFSPASQPAR